MVVVRPDFLSVAVYSTAIAASGSPGERFIVLMDAAEIALADDGESTISFSQNAALQMSDTPSTGAQPLLSLWQHNLVGIRGERFTNFVVRRPGAVAVLRNVTY